MERRVKERLVAIAFLFVLAVPSYGVAGSTPTATPVSQSAIATTYSPQGPRLGLDLAWYIKNGFGGLHGVNCTTDATGCYNYLTHGWKTSGGTSGGFFTAYAYELHSPPLYPPQYYSPHGGSDRTWLLDFIHAANSDASGQRAKIFVRLVAINNFDSTLLGTLRDFLKQVGPAQNNPSVAGFGFRGAQEGINEAGGACCNGNFVPANVAYGPSGMDSFPQDAAAFSSMWGAMQNLTNSYGYNLGLSTGLSVMDTALGQSASSSAAQWFIQGKTIQPSVMSDSPTDMNYVKGVKSFRDAVLSPARAPGVSEGVVFGEWDPNWFVVGYPQSGYYATQYGIEAAMDGFSQGWAQYPQRAQYFFIYGMPYLTNDDYSSVMAHGSSPFMGWLLQYANQFGFQTDYIAPPAPASIVSFTPPPQSPIVPTGTYIHILGNPALHNSKPGYSQTDPVICCGLNNYTIDGRLTDISTGIGILGKKISVHVFDFATCKWTLLKTPSGVPIEPTTGSNGNWGPLSVQSPPLPNTGRSQAYFYSSFSGDQAYGPSNGVLEDLLVFPASTAVSTTTSTTSSASVSSVSTTTAVSTVSTHTTSLVSSTTSQSATTGSTSTTTATTTAGGTPAQPSFEVTLSKSSGTVVKGASTSTVASVFFGSGYSAVAFSVSALPAGLTVNFSTTTDGTGYSSEVTFHASASSIPGTYNVQVLARVGSITKPASFAISVREPEYRLMVDAPPSGGGLTIPSMGAYIADNGTSFSIEARSDPGWKLDHWVVNGLEAGNGTSIRLSLTRDIEVMPFFVPSKDDSAATTVDFPNFGSITSTLVIDNITYALPASFGWTLGSVHEVVAPMLISENGNSRWVFAGWSLSEYENSATIRLNVAHDETLSPYYRLQYLERVRTVDCNGQPLFPLSLTVVDPQGRPVSLDNRSSGWFFSGQTYRLSNAVLDRVVVVGSDSSQTSFTPSGEAEVVLGVPVCDASIRVTDYFGIPIEGANVFLSFQDGGWASSDSDSNGVAVFTNIPERPYTARVSYLSMDAQIVGDPSSQRVVEAKVVFAYPLLGVTVAFTALFFAVGIAKHRSHRAT